MLAPLRRHDFALLWTAGLVSVAGDFVLFAALPIHVFALTGSAVATAGVFVAGLAPQIVLGSVAGVFVDRWDRKRTMVAANLVWAAALLPLLLVAGADDLWIVYAVRAASGAIGTFFRPAESALLPRLVGRELIAPANALNALNNNLGRLVGPAVGAALYARFGLGAAVLADVVTFIVGAVLVALIRAHGRPEPGSGAGAVPGGSAFGRVVGEWRAGLRLVAGDRVLATVFGAMAVGFVAEGTFEAGITPLAVDELAVGVAGLAVLISAQSVGGLIAGAVVAASAARIAPRALFVGSLIGCGLADLGFANAGTLAGPGTGALVVGTVFMVLAGVPFVALQTAETTIVQERTEDVFRGRVFGALGAIGGLATLAGLLIGGPAVDAFGAAPVMTVGAAMWIVGGLVALARLPQGAAARRPAAAPLRE
jgi:hypothetical protein